MRIALIADVHANLPALEAVWADIHRQGITAVYCLGDLVGYYPWPNEVIAFIREHGIRCIQGNYDEGVGEELLACGCDFPNAEAARLGETSLNWTIDTVSEDNKVWLRALPKELVFAAEGRTFWLVHGSPWRNNEYLTADYPEAPLRELLVSTGRDVLVCSHTHLAYHRQYGSKHVINAGSAGKPKHGNPNVTYVVVELGSKVAVSVIEVPYDSEAAAAAVQPAGLPVEFAAILRTGLAR